MLPWLLTWPAVGMVIEALASLRDFETEPLTKEKRNQTASGTCKKTSSQAQITIDQMAACGPTAGVTEERLCVGIFFALNEVVTFFLDFFAGNIVSKQGWRTAHCCQ